MTRTEQDRDDSQTIPEPPVRRLRRIWRDRLKPVWRDARAPTVLALALIVFGLGIWGYLRYHHKGTPEYDFWDSAYRALPLFGFGGAVDPPLPWQLQVARFVGPLLVGYGIVRGLVAISREQISFLAFRHLLRNHVVVAGLGTAGFSLATTLHEAGFRVVAIDQDPANTKIQGCRERGIGVLVGDAADPSLLRGAGVHRARYLAITCGDDGVNLNAAESTRSLAAGRPTGALTTYAELDDPDLWRMMRKKEIAEPPELAFRLELFNVFAIAARMLLEKFPPFEDGAREPHVLVVGLDGVGESLVLQIAWLWQRQDKESGDALTITIVGPSAPEARGRLTSRHPDLEEICELHAHEMDPDWSQFDRREIAMGASAVYVSLGSETDAVAATLALRGQTDTPSVPIVVALGYEDTGIASTLRAARHGGENIHVFGVLSRTMTAELLVRGTNEILAREIHEDYLNKRIEEGHAIGDKPSHVPWEQLPELYREFNRSAAADIGRKLAEIGCVIVPDPLVKVPSRVPPDRPDAFYTEAELRELERMEHQRWWDEHRQLGYRLGPEANDEKKTHPDLVPWEQLDPAVQKYDREQVQNYPRILALTGFRIDRLAPATPEGSDGRVAAREYRSHFGG